MEKQIYIFKVSSSFQKTIYRVMELEGKTSLHQFAKVIVDAFDFNFDHAFGFHDNIKNMHNSKEVYTLFRVEGGPIDRKEKSVKENHIDKVFKPDKKMIFHYDYGYDWMFLVECLDVADPEAGKTYPIITKKNGKAPPQYQRDECDDSDEDEDCEDDEMED